MRKEPPVLMDVKQVASLLKVCEATVYRWRRDGDFPPPLKLGSSNRWRLSDIEDWLDKHRMAG